METATLSELYKQQRIIRDQISDIIDGERKQRNATLVGKCYHYRNSSYGEAEAWWVYAKVTGIESDGSLNLFTFQTYPSGKVMVESHNLWSEIAGSWSEISNEDFLDEWLGLLGGLSGV